MLTQHIIRTAVEAALAEDAPYGDITCETTIPADETGSAHLTARERGVMSGIAVFTAAFTAQNPGIGVSPLIADGERFQRGQILATVEGPVRDLLAAERIALNFTQRMSGIATYTRRMADALAGTKTVLADTRKTTPGMRIFEKEAVRLGGGANHRYNLSSAVMLKDNHIDAAGGIAQAVAAARAHASFTCTIEVECETLDMVREAVDAGADIIMLDNMDRDHMARAIALIDGRAVVEASGNVDLDSIRELADLGVDVISSGALTHSAGILDLSLKHLRMIGDEGVAAGAADTALRAGEDK